MRMLYHIWIDYQILFLYSVGGFHIKWIRLRTFGIQNYKFLNQNPSLRVTIEGHCDERGTREYNLALGDRRASAVRDYLVAKGINASRLSTISYGKERPSVGGSNDTSYALNRRSVSRIDS